MFHNNSASSIDIPKVGSRVLVVANKFEGPARYFGKKGTVKLILADKIIVAIDGEEYSHIHQHPWFVKHELKILNA